METGGLLLRQTGGGAAWMVHGVSDKSVQNIAIPANVGGKPIVEIATGAFRGCKRLETLVVPNSVACVGVGAFDGCVALKHVFCPTAALTSLPRKPLKMVKITGGESIPVCAFERCEALQEVAVADGVQSIGAWAFACCVSLQSIAFPNSVKSIGERAFHRCHSLQSVALDGVKSIGDSAFAYCTSLAEISLPAGLETLGEWALVGCSSLGSICVGEGNSSYASMDGNLYTNGGKTLLYYAVGKCEAAFIVPHGVVEIGAHAFEGCALESVVLPDSVQSIGAWAFHGCKRLKSVKFGVGLQRIGDGAFNACDALFGIELPEGISIGRWTFDGAKKMAVK